MIPTTANQIILELSRHDWRQNGVLSVEYKPIIQKEPFLETYRFRLEHLDRSHTLFAQTAALVTWLEEYSGHKIRTVYLRKMDGTTDVAVVAVDSDELLGVLTIPTPESTKQYIQTT
jgi:hypothetical protein